LPLPKQENVPEYLQYVYDDVESLRSGHYCMIFLKYNLQSRCHRSGFFYGPLTLEGGNIGEVYGKEGREK